MQVQHTKQKLWSIRFNNNNRVFLIRQLWTINYYVKSWLNNLSKEMVFSDKWYFKNISFWHFNSYFVLKTEKLQVFVMITENFWWIFWRTFLQHYLTITKLQLQDFSDFFKFFQSEVKILNDFLLQLTKKHWCYQGRN